MANSKLQGKTANIPEKVRTHLSRIFTAYNGDETVEGYARLKTLTTKNTITYEQAKRMKNFFDNYEGERKGTPYYLMVGLT